uniref:Uncharacterized protein n=1 Tax=Arundo donax TaxID=35708 RepID=A0A0A9HCR5_ARUDO
MCGSERKSTPLKLLHACMASCTQPYMHECACVLSYSVVCSRHYAGCLA